jgi:hypothetical protein
MAIAGRASVSPRCAPITVSSSTSRLTTESNRGLTSTMPCGFFRWRQKHSGLRRKLVRSRHSTLGRTVPGSSAVPFSPQRRRVPSPNAHARTQGSRGIASRSAKPVLFNDIDSWLLRCALVVVPSALDDDDLSFPQRIEDLPVQQFVAQAHIEAQVPGR